MTGMLLATTVTVTLWHPLTSKENRLIPAHFFNKFVLIDLGIQMFLVSGVMLAAVYYIPLFAFTRGDETMEAGIRLLPFVALLVFTSILNGVLMPKSGHYAPWYVVGSGLAVVGCALMSPMFPRQSRHAKRRGTVTVRDSTEVFNVYGYTVLVGAGAGCYLASGFAVMQALVPAEDIVSAVGFQSIAQVLGMVAFLSVSGSLFYNSASELITPVLPAGTQPDFVRDLITGTSSAAFQSLGSDLAHRVTEKIAESMRNVWIFNLAAASLSFALSLSWAAEAHKLGVLRSHEGRLRYD